jgi:hypothetical protein
MCKPNYSTLICVNLITGSKLSNVTDTVNYACGSIIKLRVRLGLVLLVKETGLPSENHRPAARH